MAQDGAVEGKKKKSKKDKKAELEDLKQEIDMVTIHDNFPHAIQISTICLDG